MSDVVCTIDGHSVTVPAGTNVIEAAKGLKIEVPHYCYHQRLSVAGNCRMCLVRVGLPKRQPDGSFAKDAEGNVEIHFLPKLQIGCATPVTAGMVVETRAEEVLTARRGVMEFLLINHPLDCPICDQAGECRLQEFAVDHGSGTSRFVELKVHKPKHVSLGAKIMLDNERCILCSRCERFMREVAGQDCLGFTKRGSHVELSCYPGNEPNTNYDLNLVDICPVGALTSKDFRFRMRPWFLKETRSVCPGCSRGCNTTLWSREQEVYRLTPRDNDAVNQSWMCDQGRLGYKSLTARERLLRPRRRFVADSPLVECSWSVALQTAAELLQRYSNVPEQIAVIGSANASTEEQFLLRQIVTHLGVTQVDCIPHLTEGDDFLRTADANANAAGAALVGLSATPLGSRLDLFRSNLNAGRLKVLLVVGEDITAAGFSAEQLSTLEGGLVVLDAFETPTVIHATVALPGTTYAERSGTFVNCQSRMQRFASAVAPPGEACADHSVLVSLLLSLGVVSHQLKLTEVFEWMTREVPALTSLTFDNLGDSGKAIDFANPGALPPATQREWQ